MSNIEKLTHEHAYLTYDDVLLLPNYSEIMPSETILDTQLHADIDLKIPIISAPMDTVTELLMAISLSALGGMGIIHRNLEISVQAEQVAETLEGRALVGAAVGVGLDLPNRLEALVNIGTSLICLDSAHGHTKNVIEAVLFVKGKYPHIPLMAGNIATYEGAKALFEAGADIVKVGMGPGSICTTRIMSGMGVPQLSALGEAVRAGREFGRAVVADGGIKTSGDIVKALAAGASAVMLGSLLAGVDEAPGAVIDRDGKKVKAYRGMGSEKAMARGSAARYGQAYKEGEAKKLVPEGVEGYVNSRGPLKEHLYQLLGGVRAGMAYLGARNVQQLQEKARFIRVSQASILESHPHSIHY